VCALRAQVFIESRLAADPRCSAAEGTCAVPDVDFNVLLAMIQVPAGPGSVDARWRAAFPGAADEQVQAWHAQYAKLADAAAIVVAKVKSGTMGITTAALFLSRDFPDIDRNRLDMEVWQTLTNADREWRPTSPEMSLATPSSLMDLIRCCEVYCDIACCGTSALDVTHVHIGSWIDRSGLQAAYLARQQLADLVLKVEHYPGKVTSVEFNDEWSSGSQCADYLREWCRELDQAIALCEAP